MNQPRRNICYRLLAVATLFFASMSAVAGDPMDDVFSLLDSGGGTRSGINKVDGYYVVAMGTSGRSSESKGYEEARMGAPSTTNRNDQRRCYERQHPGFDDIYHRC